jgi:hypothetical protein
MKLTIAGIIATSLLGLNLLAQTILPVVEPGKANAKLFNPGPTATYTLTFYQHGVAPTGGEPTFQVSLNENQTATIPDLASEFNAANAGSVVIDQDPVVSLVNEGKSIPTFTLDEMVNGTLRGVAPAAQNGLAFTTGSDVIGITWRVYDAFENQKGSASGNYAPNTTIKMNDVAPFLGVSLAAGDTLEATITSGKAAVMLLANGSGSLLKPYTAPVLTEAAQYTKGAFPQKGGTAWIDIEADGQLRSMFAEPLALYGGMDIDSGSAQIRNATAMTKKKPGKLGPIPAPGTAYKVFRAPAVLSFGIKVKKNIPMEDALFNTVYAASMYHNESSGKRPIYSSKTPGQ